MPRQVPEALKQEAINLMRYEDASQREISRHTGLSRPYIQKLAKDVGHVFKRNGFEIKGHACMCCNCGMIFRRPPSKVVRAEHHFCTTFCKSMYMRGIKNSNWKGGSSTKTFSEWIKRQSSYKEWRAAVLKRDDNTCQVTGLKASDGVQIDAHHIFPKADYQHLSLEISNGLTVCKEAHDLIHELVRGGKGFDEAIEEATKKFKKDKK